MSLNLTIVLLAVSIFIIFLTTHFLKKGRIPEKYSLLWYGFGIIILLVGIFPEFMGSISEDFGFEVMSNFIIGIIIGILILLTMALTIIIAGQKKKTTLLIQEISILRSEIKNEKK